MAQRERDTMMKHGTAQTKVAGDDEMLRTGFHNGTPLEAGKIADSQPVDLFAPAHRVAAAAGGGDGDNAPSLQQQDEEGNKKTIAESEPVDLLASARGVADANTTTNHHQQGQQGRQGMAEPTAGGRRLGRQA